MHSSPLMKLKIAILWLILSGAAENRLIEMLWSILGLTTPFEKIAAAIHPLPSKYHW
jgi:hypothetical protein